MIKLLMIMHMHFNLYLIAVRLKKCVKKLLILIFLQCSLFLINFKTQEMCDKATDAYLPALKFVPNWFVTNKMLET